MARRATFTSWLTWLSPYYIYLVDQEMMLWWLHLPLSRIL